MPAAAPAIPVNPSMPAISAITANINAHFNIPNNCAAGAGGKGGESGNGPQVFAEGRTRK